MSGRGSKEARLVYGASPRVDLLPPEVADRKKGAALRRSLVMGVVGAVVLSAGAYAFASWQSIQAAVELSDAQVETAALIAQQGEFGEVRTLSGLRATITDARQTGALTEIDWSLFYTDIQATLPAGMTIDQFVISANSPTRELAAPTVPTHGARAAEVTYIVTSPSLEALSTWLVTLKGVLGYADATATPAVTGPGGYTATVVLDVDSQRYTKRFAPPAPPAEETADTTAAATEGEGTN